MAERHYPKGCLGAAVTVLGVFGVLAGWFGWSLHQAAHPTPPDVGAFARAAATREADRAVTTMTDSQINAFREATPWAAYVGESTVDVCQSQIRSAFVTFHPLWSPVSCARSTTLYLAFDGSLQQRLKQLDEVTQQSLRWQAPSSNGAGPAEGLAATLAYERRPPDGAEPSQSAAASARPADISVRYSLPTGSRTSGVSGPTVSVAQKPAELQTDFWGGFAGLDGTAKQPYGNDADDRSVYLTWKPVPPKALAGTAYTSHGFLLSVSFTSSYATQQPARPAPTSPAPYYSPCYSGSGTCG